MSEKLLVPDIGDFENVEVIELLVKEGQKIANELLSAEKDIKVTTTFVVKNTGKILILLELVIMLFLLYLKQKI